MDYGSALLVDSAHLDQKSKSGMAVKEVVASLADPGGGTLCDLVVATFVVLGHHRGIELCFFCESFHQSSLARIDSIIGRQVDLFAICSGGRAVVIDS